MGGTILHVDMDAFYASVEIRDDPRLEGRAVVVAAPGPRGVVLSADYRAREFGVGSAMPVSRARRLAPEAVFVAPRPEAYAEVSEGVMALLAAITPVVETLSLDEAFLDVRGACRDRGPRELAELIRERVKEEQGVSCTVGVAPNRLLAKMATNAAKPDGLLVVPDEPEAIAAFLGPKPVQALWGIGPVTAGALERYGLRTVAQLAEVPLDSLRRILGQAQAETAYAFARGVDPRPVVPNRQEKSVGSERTFPADVADPEVISREILRAAHRVALRLRAEGLVAGSVTLKIRSSEFVTRTRTRTLTDPTDSAAALAEAARAAYAGLAQPRARVRLVGLSAGKLAPVETAPTQLSFDPTAERRRTAERTADRASARFGLGAVVPASLLDGNGVGHAAGSAAGSAAGNAAGNGTGNRAGNGVGNGARREPERGRGRDHRQQPPPGQQPPR